MSTQYLYDEKYYRDARKMQMNKERNDWFMEMVKSFGAETVLDVGCGPGMLVKSLRDEGIEAYGLDFAPSLKRIQWHGMPYFINGSALDLPFPDNSFDLVFSSEFFEHLLPDQVDIAYKEMERVGSFVVAKVAYEAKLTAKQALKHPTNKPEEWWEKKLSEAILL